MINPVRYLVAATFVLLSTHAVAKCRGLSEEACARLDRQEMMMRMEIDQTNRVVDSILRSEQERETQRSLDRLNDKIDDLDSRLPRRRF